MSKRSTKDGHKKLGSGTVKAIRDSLFLRRKIAEIADVDPSYLRHVLRGDRPPSEKLSIAISRAMLQRAREFDYQVLKHEHPEISAR